MPLAGNRVAADARVLLQGGDAYSCRLIDRSAANRAAASRSLVPHHAGTSNGRSILVGLPPELVECDVQACPGLLVADAVIVNTAHLLELLARSLCLRAELAIEV